MPAGSAFVAGRWNVATNTGVEPTMADAELTIVPRGRSLVWVRTDVQRASDCVVTGGRGDSVVDGPAVVGALPALGRSVAGSSRRTASRRAASDAN